MSLDNALLRYAVHIYSQAEVESICLQLQQHYSLSVNRVLFSLWLASEERLLAVDLLDDRRLQQWNSEILSPLRALRYRLKQAQTSAADTANCYQSFKQTELEAEKVELARLFELGVEGCELVTLDCRQLAHENLQAYLQYANITVEPQLESLLAQLIVIGIPAASD
ncbi:MAG: TIGR02444 family protein [Amphritea sp.]